VEHHAGQRLPVAGHHEWTLSVDYYTQLERGKVQGVSESVLDALARALELDEAERAHLFDLCRAANTTARPTRRSIRIVRPVTRRLVEAMTATPAIVRLATADGTAGSSATDTTSDAR
jgi:Helix-turn-helix domain